MNGLGKLTRKLYRAEPPEFGGGRDDQSIVGQMRALAVRLSVDGRARLRPDADLAGAIRRLAGEAERVLSGTMEGSEVLERFRQDARLMESCARQARMESGAQLPAHKGVPRLLETMRQLVAHGDTHLPSERLTLALKAFDEVKPLNMAELWAAPTALRLAISEAFLSLGRTLVAGGLERADAERLAGENGRGVRLRDRSAAFYERALKLAMEEELPELRARIESELGRLDESAEQVVRMEHETRALCEMRLNNLVSAKRMLDAIDWQSCFLMLSRTEKMLSNDPDGTYPRMDEESRATVRDAVRTLSVRLGLGEGTIARQAIAAAKEADVGDVRRTVCWWLYEDEGRAELLKRLHRIKGIPSNTPDPKGWKFLSAFLIGFALLFWGYASATDSLWTLAYGIPLAWSATGLFFGWLIPKIRRPARLLKMELESLGTENATLVVTPVLVSSVQRAEALADGLETLGCLCEDENAGFLLLGDFRDSAAQSEEEDEKILAILRKRVAELNRREGREKYFYLHRPRVYCEKDRRWMGKERKRGALMALNRVLLGNPGAEAAFSAEGAACEKIAGRFRYVLTLDADTRMLPGTIHKLVGAMAHPLNRPRVCSGKKRGYAILQPNMELAASSVKNRFLQIFAGKGGVDSYPVCVSNLYQDLTGRGIFGGKGIYDVAAFMQALEGALPDGRILSHDLIEGEIAGAGFVSDVSLYDGFPETMSGYLNRLNRWTRGDWQLLPFLFRKGLSALSRFKLLDNLLRSLAEPSLLGLLITGCWFGLKPAFALGVLYAFLGPLFSLRHFNSLDWRRAVLRLAALPSIASAGMDAILRTLFRLAFTQKHMLDWVTSADATAGGVRVGTACRVTAILLIPGLFAPGMAPGCLALGALFLVAPGYLRDLQNTTTDPRGGLTMPQIAVLGELARDTWNFFAECVSERENFLPPDNVQIDPPVGAARRTSPTNIGLYLLSCLSAQELGFLRQDEMLERLENTIGTVEKLEKWNGHLYNWYDIDSLCPLRPLYVSSVDGGNFAACLLTLESALRRECPALADRMRALAEAMDFRALLDEERKLFVIGVDAQTGQKSASHYDLLASESRILSLVAMMLKEVDPAHWKKLSRPVVSCRGGQALLSWSGTMFEYLMPEIFTHSCPGTLLGESNRTVALLQRRAGEEAHRPWGVSESGYYAFDMRLNYQYRAFGLRSLSLGGGARGGVVAPYASVLALCVCPARVADNVRRMRELGWSGRYGLYEAADYEDGKAAPRLVKSFMAHHQGMMLAALTNALADNAISRYFESIPEARALSLLLEEKPCAPIQLGNRRTLSSLEPARHLEEREWRTARLENRLADTHLLSGAGATVEITARGQWRYVREGIQMNRFWADFVGEGESEILQARNCVTGERFSLLEGAKGIFDAGWAGYRQEAHGLESEVTICVSPEDGTLFFHLRIRNASERSAAIQLLHAFPVALCTPAAMRAHPAFENLFVCSERAGENALVFSRRPGAPGQTPLRLAAMYSGRLRAVETDWAALRSREGRKYQLRGTVGCTLNPCAAMEGEMFLEAGETKEAHFAFGLLLPGEIPAWLEKNAAADAPERARRLANTQVRAMLGFLGLNADKHHLLSRATAFFADVRLSRRAGKFGPAGSAERPALWAMGISGDLPILSVRVGSREEVCLARDAVRAHEYYRTMGLTVDLVLVNDYGNDYEQPVRDALRDLVDSSHLRELSGRPGGVFLLDGTQLTEAQRALLERSSAMWISGGTNFWAEVRKTLVHLEFGGKANMRAIPRGNFRLRPMERAFWNGYGGFCGENYVMDLDRDQLPPAPWSNVLAGEGIGAVVTERGGGFLFAGNSRLERITPFWNDPVDDGWGLMVYLADERRGAYVRALPGKSPMTPFRVTHAPAFSRFESGAEGLEFSTTLYAMADCPALGVEVQVKNTAQRPVEYAITLFLDWLMGADMQDARVTRAWTGENLLLATGAMAGTGYLAALDVPAETGAERAQFLGHGGAMRPDGLMEQRGGEGGWALKARVRLGSGERKKVSFAIGLERDAQAVSRRVEWLRGNPGALRRAQESWNERLGALRIHTPDPALNQIFHSFLPKQVLGCRILARAGFYQAGGAYGFRDQLQDMLAMLPYAPERVREHLLRAAARQFEDGDVLHWWHMPFSGVRTRISDDCLFLPYVLAAYVRATGDTALLLEEVPFLQNVEIPEEKEDWYGQAVPTQNTASLHEHCMRALRRASRTGEHGLALMGTGDWNDGMNRVGARGKGESVWLTEFLSVVAAEYAEIAPDERDRAWLNALCAQMNAAVEEFGWDGNWYLRAYDDDGEKLGSASGAVCRIDLIAQAWAALCGLDQERVTRALTSAWENLAEEEVGIFRLLTPPFDGDCKNPGYILGYPPGVRENGGQYTHGACWYLLALIHEGETEKAHRAVKMLNPIDHARTRQEADRYRVEPYVVAADIYAGNPYGGRGGWTWYTGAAGWYLRAILALLGYERRERCVRLNALMGDWPEAEVAVRFGSAEYRLICRRDAKEVTLDGSRVPGEWIEMVDDAEQHTAVFPPRDDGHASARSVVCAETNRKDETV
ncbi:MAG TPA: hypothetical protein IAB02_08935 [Candidatus Pullichristensenella excrementigallinarum]|uniref:Glycosyltransferase 36 n=1 Tax=Candidatus Pullichristensenella excrementigallinarum TaxID=2840907 RepID=A0A9D1LCP5_9FIRM|nr:hypothetical protein [Candidatus Pullichristensenella excrementigallinarum]